MAELASTLNAFEALGAAENVTVEFLGSADTPIIEVSEQYEPASTLPFGGGRMIGILTRVITLHPDTGIFEVQSRNIEQGAGGAQGLVSLTSRSSTNRGFVWVKSINKRRIDGETVTSGLDSTVVNNQIKQVLAAGGWQKKPGFFAKLLGRGTASAI